LTDGLKAPQQAKYTLAGDPAKPVPFNATEAAPFSIRPKPRSFKKLFMKLAPATSDKLSRVLLAVESGALDELGIVLPQLGMNRRIGGSTAAVF
jgi:hypothetical protein